MTRLAWLLAVVLLALAALTLLAPAWLVDVALRRASDNRLRIDNASGTFPELAQIPILLPSIPNAASFSRTCRMSASRSAAGCRFAYVIATSPDAAISRPQPMEDCISLNLQPTNFSNPTSGYPATMTTTGVRARR